MWCVVHFMLTPETPELQGMRCPKQNTTTKEEEEEEEKKLLSSCFSKRISPKVHRPPQQECLRGKGRLRNGPGSSAGTSQKDQREASGPLTPTTALPSAGLAKSHRSVVVPSPELKIKALVSVRSLTLPCPSPRPAGPVYVHASSWTNSVSAGVFLPLARTGHSQTFQL